MGKIKNNIALKIIALVFAVLLWWAVANIDDPIVSKSFRTTVSVVHPEVVTNVGKSYHIEDSTQNITVTVKARRSVTEAVKAKNIRATADFREMQDSSIPIRVTIKGYEGQYEEVLANPQNLRVTTEDTQKKTFPITAVTGGEVSSGYVLGDVTVKPQSIDISGPRTVIGRITKVVAKVDVSALSENTTLNAELIYYDSAENIIDDSLLSSNCDKNGVKVQVKLLETKKISLKFDTSQIETASGYLFQEISVNQKEITVCADSDILDSMSELEIPGSALAKKKLKSNKDVIVDISQYLPDGVVLQDEDAGSVVVTIIVDKSGTKSILLPVRSIRVNGISDELELSYGPEQEVELNFRGKDENLAKLTESNIIAIIDLAEYTKEGTYKVPVQLLEMPDGCKYLGKAKVQVVLSKKDDEAGE